MNVAYDRDVGERRRKCRDECASQTRCFFESENVASRGVHEKDDGGGGGGGIDVIRSGTTTATKAETDTRRDASQILTNCIF